MHPEPRRGSVEDFKDITHLVWTCTSRTDSFHITSIYRTTGQGETVISDHSRVDWEIPGGTGKKRPIPTELDTLSDATELTYANKIDVIGDIGPDLMGFSETDEAKAFANNHVGSTITYKSSDRPLVDKIQMTDME
ncbi:NosL family protein [Halorubrum sp. JWXQ-INN 858]|nr:NosL family protein [Halorubrum sp. JWXQ-INN 858]